VFVKGGDYTRERLPEAGLVEQLGGQVVILPLVADRSTTGLIRRLRVHAALPSANGVAGR
jgi:D-beta-D-heptose 7-phosphate kinase/D-beta-D-heptose 1-phosphate adenosyltransferase